MTANDAQQDDNFNALKPIEDAKVTPAHGLAALALNLALKYHDINTVQDGALYQQYKLEGKNMQAFHLDHVFDTAMKMEAHILGSSKRLASIVSNLVEQIIADEAATAIAEETLSKGSEEPKND